MSRIGLARTLIAAIVAASAASVLAQPAPSLNRAAAPSPNQSKPPADALPPITLPQFEQAAQIARLAAEHEMYELSQRAISRALANGPPLDVQTMSMLAKPKPRTRVRAGTAAAAGSTANIEAQVLQTLDLLAQPWQKAPPEEVYQTLLGVVMPEGRPREIFLYDASAGASPQFQQFGGFAGSTSVRGRRVRGAVRPYRGGVQWPGVSRLLVDAAVRAGQVDDLKQRISSRNDEHAEFAATILLAQLAILDRRLDAASCWPYLEQLAKHEPPVYAAQLLRELTAKIEGRELPAEMVAWLETRFEHETVESRGIADDQTWLKLLVALARWQFANGNVEQARRHLKRYAEHGMGGEAQPDERERYRVTAWLNVAREFLQHDLLDDALEALGKHVDATDGSPRVMLLGTAWREVRKRLDDLSVEDRYQRLLTLTLPDDGRPRVRFVGCFVRRDHRPTLFQNARYRALPDDEITSNFGSLLDAAREAGRLDDLEQRLTTCDDDNIERTALGVLLAADEERGKLRSHLQRWLATRQSEWSKPAQFSPYVSLAAYLLARECLHDDGLREFGRTLAMTLKVSQGLRVDNEALAYLDFELTAATARECGADPRELADVAFVHWHPARSGQSWVARSNPRQWWAEEDGCLRCVSGSAEGSLILDYPLEGSGDLSADLLADAPGSLSYGGVWISPYGLQRPSSVLFPVMVADGPVDAVMPVARDGPAKRWTLHVEDGKKRIVFGGEAVCEVSAPDRACPWLALCAWSPSSAAFRSVSISGDWRVPREVKLIDGEHLVGWTGGFYEPQAIPETNVGFRPKAAQAAEEFQGRLVRVRGKPGEPARFKPANGGWSVVDGEIRGTNLLYREGPTPSPSRLTYFRPLRNGEALRYEFYYFPRHTMVCPALDRLTFLLEPEGVRLHWMTDHPDLEAGALPLDNVADEPAARRGPAHLPLVERDWNRVALKLVDDEVLIDLNGVAIFQRKLETTNDRSFSFFHYEDRTHATIRNVVLSGDWPEMLPPEEELFAHTRPLREAERAANAKLVNAEEFKSDQPNAEEKAK